MQRKIVSRFSLLIFMVIILTGCSSSSNTPVTVPDKNPEGITAPVIADSLNSGQGVWGMYEGTLDIDTLDASLVPLRMVSGGTSESALVDITSFLIGTPCHDCVRIKTVSLDSDSNPVVTIGIRHPYPAGIQSNPPSAINRLDLHLFSVRGFIISDGNSPVKTYPSTGRKVGGFELVSADGLSGEFDTYWDNYFSTTANLHPYMLHFDDYSQGNFDPLNEFGFTDMTLPQGNLVMPMGSVMDYQNYTFHFTGTGSFNFLYAVSASYGVAAVGKNQWLFPTYRIPQFNAKAATEVRITNVDDSELIGGDTDSTCSVTVQVKDINHNVAVGEEIDKMTADSSVSRFKIEIPSVTDPVWDKSTPILYLVSGDGRVSPLIYDLIIPNDAGAPPGNYTGLLAVYDSFTGIGNLPGNAIYGLPPGGDPTTAFFTVDEWITYTTFDVEVKQGCGPITGSITTPSSPSVTIMNGGTVIVAGTGSSANGGGPITEYRWNWGDGSPDTLAETTSHVFTNPNCGGSDLTVSYSVKLTLKDSCSPPNVTQVGSFLVNVECPDCLDMFENFDGGTVGDWSPSNWSYQNVDSGGLYLGGFDEYIYHSAGMNCSTSMCKSGNCWFNSGDDFTHGGNGFCNDYSGPGHYYLISPTLNLRSLEVSELSMSVWHFFNVLSGGDPDGCTLYASIDGGVTFPTQVDVVGGIDYNSTFASGVRVGGACFTGLITGGGPAETIFNLTPFLNQSNVVLRFEQHNIFDDGPVGTVSFPVGWWIDDITIYICP